LDRFEMVKEGENQASLGTATPEPLTRFGLSVGLLSESAAQARAATSPTLGVYVNTEDP
jgi:hypothetical protein